MARRSQASLSLYRTTDAEGYLDKLSTGITSRLLGKTRMWCELYGTSFYVFRENKAKGLAKHLETDTRTRKVATITCSFTTFKMAARRSSSEANMIDMKSVQMVRKVTSDKTGTHFEIVCKNKSQSFCAVSAEECEKWIKKLQHAMSLRDQENAESLSQDVSEVSIGDYELIDVFPPEGDPQAQPRQSTASESAYAEIGFDNQPVDPQKIPAFTAPAAGSATPRGEQSLQQVAEEQSAGDEQQKEDYGYAQAGTVCEEALQGGLKEQPTGDTQQEEEYGYAKVQARKTSIQDDQALADTNVTEERTEAEGEDSYGYAKVQSRTAPTVPILDPLKNSNKLEDEEARSPGDGADSGGGDDDDDEEEEEEDDDDLYMEAMSKRVPDPIPELPNPLTPSDTAPLKTVLEFLSENRQVCRRSYYDMKLTGDPVASMKKLLQEIS